MNFYNIFINDFKYSININKLWYYLLSLDSWIFQIMTLQEQGCYNTSYMIVSEYEPGSHRRVLKNLYKIKSRREMDKLEYDQYLSELNIFIDTYSLDHRFTIADICNMHKMWLDKIYQ